jgi:hypothetical protein
MSGTSGVFLFLFWKEQFTPYGSALFCTKSGQQRAAALSSHVPRIGINTVALAEEMI